ncbi:unnamed protein product [Penicillium camemberti]|uniref:Str. FM013 n=1 Tax=Penicillium camemberti (strain FM 013) TaxID=1429867 RepID=A0A0G4NVF9_PENC3|nr:unnamed protein product [Penicillium camemberti]
MVGLAVAWPRSHTRAAYVDNIGTPTRAIDRGTYLVPSFPSFSIPPNLLITFQSK